MWRLEKGEGYGWFGDRLLELFCCLFRSTMKLKSKYHENQMRVNELNRKLRVATKIGSNFFLIFNKLPGS
jgi:hypothetical protein